MAQMGGAIWLICVGQSERFFLYFLGRGVGLSTLFLFFFPLFSSLIPKIILVINLFFLKLSHKGTQLIVATCSMQILESTLVILNYQCGSN